MLKIDNILLTTDLAAPSALAVGYATHLARVFDADLHWLHVAGPDNSVVERGKGYDFSDDVPRSGESQDMYLPQISANVSRVVQTVREAEEIAPIIIKYAEEHAIDVIIMGPHRRRSSTELFMGSIAEEVVRLAPCPVMSVQSDDRDTGHPAIQKILMPFDFSAPSQVALRYAGEIARLCDAEVHVVHVVDEVVGADHVDPFILSDSDPVDLTRKSLIKVVEAAGLSEASVDIRTGDVATQLLYVIDTRQIDLVVMATRGWSLTRRYVLGSVAEKMVREAPCPVLAVKDFGRSLLRDDEISAMATPTL